MGWVLMQTDKRFPRQRSVRTHLMLNDWERFEEGVPVLFDNDLEAQNQYELKENLERVPKQELSERLDTVKQLTRLMFKLEKLP